MSELNPDYLRHLMNADKNLNRCAIERSKPYRGQGQPNEQAIENEIRTAINELRFAVGEISQEEYLFQSLALNETSIRKERDAAA